MSNPTKFKPRVGKSDFSIRDMAVIFDESDGKPDKPHRHNYYTVIFAIHAIGQHIIDFQSYTFSQNQLYFISPGQIHQVLTTERPRGWAITFSEDFLIQNNIQISFISNLNLFSTYGNSPPLHIESETKEKLVALIHDMKQCLQTTHKYKSTALGALVQLFLIYTNNSTSVSPTATDEDNKSICMLRDFKTLLESHHTKWHKVRDYASHIHISPKHLSSTVKSLTGQTAKEMISDRLHLEAKRLLLHTSLSIKEIGYHIGFDSPLHFSAFFKKIGGMSPTSFRESHNPFRS